MLVTGRARRALPEALPGMWRYGAPRQGGRLAPFSYRESLPRPRGRVEHTVAYAPDLSVRLRIRKKRGAGCHFGHWPTRCAPKWRAHHPFHVSATQWLRWRFSAVQKGDLERLGQSNMGITLSIYAHVLPSMQKDAATVLDRLLG